MSGDGVARRVCGLLADPERASVFASVVLGSTTADAVGTATKLSAGTVARALRQLDTGGVLTSDAAGGWSANLDALANAAAGRDHDPAADEADPDRASLLRRFLAADGSLTEIPASASKRRVVLEHIAGRFEIGVTYPERVVTLRLREFHADHAALRRYLIDAELLERRDGNYWRSGGPVEV